MKDYAFASGGILWKIFDRPKFESKSIRTQILYVFLVILICWLPLAILSYFKLGWNQFYLLFARDISTHVRILIVIPILIFARRSVNNGFNKTISLFYETKIVDQTNAKALERVLGKVEKWKNSLFIDLVILVLIYISFFIQQDKSVNSSNVYVPWHIVNDRITVAGWWYLLISLPVLQMLLYRWLYTILLWIIFLSRIPKLNLHLSALHPDGAGGLGFLHYTQLTYFPVALAFSALTAGVTNNLIMFSGISIADYKIAIGSILGFVLMLFILPLMLLLPMLAKVKREYFIQYSLQAWPITRKYEEELEAYYKTEKENPDTSWHVDLLGSFEKANDMKIILVDRTLLVAFTAAVVLPFLPVVAQQIPLKDIFLSLVGKILG